MLLLALSAYWNKHREIMKINLVRQKVLHSVIEILAKDNAGRKIIR